VWAEHVASRLGQSGDAAPAGMSLAYLGQIAGTGQNYAIGGAETGYGGALGPLSIFIPTGIRSQVGFYLGRTNGSADPDALYFVFGGGNDLRTAATLANPAARSLAALSAGANLAYAIRDLYLAGARNFVLINAPDIGLIPETIGDGISEAGTHASLEFNTWLGLYAAYLPSVPGVSLQYFDLFGLHRELVDQYGFDAIRPCRSNVSECGQSLFFDSVHPTAWVHEIIGNRLADQILGAQNPMFMSDGGLEVVENPEPSTLLLTAGAIAVLACRRKIRARH
jgi:outer membrane lipase/esterase